MLGRLMAAVSKVSRGRVWRLVVPGGLAFALGLLPLLLVGLASFVTFVLGPGTRTRAVHSASPPPAHSRWQGLPSGGTWVRTRLTLPTNALLEDPHQAGLVWAGTAQGVWLSPDGGATWQRAGRGLDGHAILALAATPASDTIVAGGDNGAVYVGAARGGKDGRWQRISPVLGPDHPIFSLAAVTPAGGGGTVLAGTFGALYRGVRVGSGWTWRAVAHTGEAAITSIIWAPWDAHRAYAAVFGTWPPVLGSHDDGRTWRPDTSGLPSELPTQTLLALATGARQIILSTMGDGVWLQSAAGRWHDVSAGLPARHAMPLVAVPKSREVLLYAGTMGFGVYARQGAGPWRLLGRGLSGGAYTVLALSMTSGSHPALLAGTALGLFRYVPPG
jgi:hypothetical protein